LKRSRPWPDPERRGEYKRLERKTKMRSGKPSQRATGEHALDAAAKPTPRTTLKAKRRPSIEERAPEAAAIVHTRSGGICERCRKRRATVLHHRLPQSAGGPDTPDNMVDLCEPCHTGPDGVHRNPARSYEEGWLISRYAQGNRSPD